VSYLSDLRHLGERVEPADLLDESCKAWQKGEHNSACRECAREYIWHKIKDKDMDELLPACNCGAQRECSSCASPLDDDGSVDMERVKSESQIY